MVSSNGVTITERDDGALAIRSPGNGGSIIYPVEVAALRARFAAERMPEDVQALVEWARDAALALEAATEIGKRSCRAGDHLNYSNHDRLLREFAALEAAYSKGADDDPR